mgnify:CR=1 FL=1
MEDARGGRDVGEAVEALLKQIEPHARELGSDRELEGIRDVNDESARGKTRLVIRLKKDAPTTSGRVQRNAARRRAPGPQKTWERDRSAYPFVHVVAAGSFFGEMALLDGGPRVATVTAATEVHLLVVDRRGFGRLIREKRLHKPVTQGAGFALAFFASAVIWGQFEPVSAAIYYSIYSLFFAFYAFVRGESDLGYFATGFLPLALIQFCAALNFEKWIFSLIAVALLYYVAGFTIRRSGKADGWDRMLLNSGLALGALTREWRRAASSPSSSASATRATSSRSGSRTTRCTPPT